MTRTMAVVQHTTLDEFPNFYLLFIAQLCTHYPSVPYDLCRGTEAYEMENNAQNWPKSSETQNCNRSVSSRLFLDR